MLILFIMLEQCAETRLTLAFLSAISKLSSFLPSFLLAALLNFTITPIVFSGLIE